MAVIGIAFALGFILGPAIGGILSMSDISSGVLSLLQYKHPFGIIALAGALLSSYNFLLLLLFLPETHTPTQEKVHIPLLEKWIPFLRKGFSKELVLMNWSYFLYLMTFSGMEFTLTFLSFERFKYGPMQNAYMFIFSGVVIALVQGGIVRRKASLIGEARLVKVGLISVVFGLLFIAMASGQLFLYLGLFFLASGSGLIIPCLTTLVTLHSGAIAQGESVGVFRSFGSFARILGPLLATLLYWNFGSMVAYALGGVLIIIPLLIFRKLGDA
jgi:MFS family permease